MPFYGGEGGAMDNQLLKLLAYLIDLKRSPNIVAANAAHWNYERLQSNFE